jgi:hypothetical protein
MRAATIVPRKRRAAIAEVMGKRRQRLAGVDQLQDARRDKAKSFSK